MRSQVALNGNWHLAGLTGKKVDKNGWIDAQVPGDVHVDLSRAGLLPFFGHQDTGC